jgi:hypothetical protein
VARRVALVLDREYGAKLEDLAMKMEVWLVESETNRAAAGALSTLAHEWPHISVTIFRAPAALNEESWRFVLDQLQLHQRPSARRVSFETVDVIGVDATPDARRVLSDLGFDTISLTPEGFRATR